jgi:hypothetical protein
VSFIIMLAATLSSATMPNQNITTSFTIDFPDPENEESAGTPVINKIVVENDGKMFWNGYKIGKSQLFNYDNQISLMEPVGLQVQPFPDVPASVFYDFIKSLYETKTFKKSYYIVGNENYEKFSRSKFISHTILNEKSIPSEISIEIFSTDKNKKEPTSDGYSGSSPNGDCRIFLNGTSVNYKEFSKQLSETLIQQMLKFKTQSSDELSLHSWIRTFPPSSIFVDKSAPYRCIGGALYGLQAAGFARASFIAFREFSEHPK